MKMTTAKLRMLVCGLIGIWLIGSGIGIFNSADVFTQSYSASLIAFGMFFEIFAFRPSAAKDLIRSVTKILKRH
jgi:hypothetical protein